MEQDKTLLEPTPAPKKLNKKQNNPQRKRIKTQRWWQFHGMQAGLFAVIGAVGGY